jgi:hypothetical protein
MTTGCQGLLVVDQLVLWLQTLSEGGLHGGPAIGEAPVIQAEVDARVGAAGNKFSNYNAIPMQQDAYKRSCAAGVSLTLTRPV